MIKGLYSAASAMVAGINLQQALAHNVANLETPGFKQILMTLEDFMQTPVTQPAGDGSQSGVSYVGDLGLGVLTGPNINDFEQGGIETTGHPLDLAIEGPGFFRVQTAGGERYTRDGRFVRDAEGQLVTIDGYKVLGENGQPLQIPDGEILIGTDGAITANGEAAGKIGLAFFKDPGVELTREEDNTFSASGAPSGDASGTIQQGALEMSNANPTQLMTMLVEVARSYQAAQQMVQTQDSLLGQTIDTLGRIA
ncbi:MAG: flagellar hook-basal body protein [Chloroflexi bacterium]|nr:flagellar hook-basal body protein [Chloroflexota bacterium]